MDQAHSRAMEALQPFIHMATTTNPSPKFVANLITNATSSPNTYIFAELLNTRAVNALRAPDTPSEYQPYVTLLEIFAWGTYQDYQSTPSLPALTPEQTLKLRLLSLLTLSTTTKPLTYESLMNALSLPTAEDLESLITTAIYASLLTARLSPATSPPTVTVTAVAPLRDVPAHALPSMINLLSQWESRCAAVCSDIEAEIAHIQVSAATRRERENARAALFEKALADVSKSAAAEAAAGGDLNPRAGGAAAKKAGWSMRGGIPGHGGNKREFNPDDLEDDDDGYWDHGSEGFDSQGVSSRMDIDDVGLRTGTRHAKRVLGKKS